MPNIAMDIAYIVPNVLVGQAFTCFRVLLEQHNVQQIFLVCWVASSLVYDCERLASFLFARKL